MRFLALVTATLATLAIGCGETSESPSRTTTKATSGTAGSTATGTGSGGSTATGTGGTGTGGNGTGGSGATGGSGGSGASGGTGGTGQGGSGPFDAGGARDASKPDVNFDWPETVPGLKCKAGHYTGAFTGTYMTAATIFPLPVPVTGNIDLTLVQTANGEIFEITNGKLAGTADLIVPFSADLVGKLDCRVSKLDPSTALKNGSYIFLGIPIGFEGPFLGDYDKKASAFVNGTWDIKEMNPMYGGTGSWNAAWMGP